MRDKVSSTALPANSICPSMNPPNLDPDAARSAKSCSTGSRPARSGAADAPTEDARAAGLRSADRGAADSGPTDPNSGGAKAAAAPSGGSGPRAAGLVREALGLWALAFGGLVAAKALGLVIPFIGRQVKAVAAGLFLYLPGPTLRRRDETVDDLGVPDWPWRSAAAAADFRRDLKWGVGTCLILFVPVVVGFFLSLELLQYLPEELRRLVIPYTSGAAEVALRFPEQMWLHVLDQVLVVALPEEFFYRGYLQTRLKQAWGSGRTRLLGVQVGAAFWVTQLLFAVGHLGEFHPWRLMVFFPALLFGWLRERTGSIGPAIIVHAFSNLLLMTLEASAFGW